MKDIIEEMIADLGEGREYIMKVFESHTSEIEKGFYLGLLYSLIGDYQKELRDILENMSNVGEAVSCNYSEKENK